MKVIQFFIFFSLCFGANTQQLISKLSNDTILIGQQAQLELQVICHASDSIEWFEQKDTLNQFIEVVEYSKIDTSFNQEDIRIKTLKQTITITCFDSGFYQIKPFSIGISENRLTFDTLNLNVLTFQVDTAKGITDIKPILETPLSLKDYFVLYKPYILVGLAVLIALFIFWYYLKNRPKKALVVKEQTPEIPAHVTALEKLKKIKAQKLWQKGKEKAYYSAITEVVCPYIEQSLYIAAVEQTSFEITRAVDRKNISNEAKTALKDLLSLSDLAKFAKIKPLPSENEQAIEHAIRFIELTKQETEKQADA